MNIPPEVIIERKTNRRNLAIWQILSVVLFTTVVSLYFNSHKLFSNHFQKADIGSEYIASITIDDDMIVENSRRDKIIQELKNNKLAKAVIVNLNCPGGTAVGSEIIYKILRDIGQDKPVVSVMNSMATSGAYMVALASEHIIAHHTTITGSIGVIIRSFEVTELAEKLGVKFINLKTNPNKAVLSPSERFTPAMEEVVMESLNDTYEYFVSLVAERRKLPIEQVKALADGRIYTGNQALQNKLIDQIGTQKDAVIWLQKNKNIAKELEIKEISLKERSSFIEEFLQEFSTSIKSSYLGHAKGLLMLMTN